MLKKIVLGLLLVGLVGVLVVGATNRTLAKTGAEEGYGIGQGNGHGDIALSGDQAGSGQGYGQGYGQGGVGQGGIQGKGQAGGQGGVAPSGDQAGVGQAQVDEWLTVSGTVTSVDADLLVVETTSGEATVENRGWWYAQEQGFAVQVGDEVRLTGFYENDHFEVGRIENLTSGQTVTLRDETGRPMWAGRGWRGG